MREREKCVYLLGVMSSFPLYLALCTSVYFYLREKDKKERVKPCTCFRVLVVIKVNCFLFVFQLLLPFILSSFFPPLDVILVILNY
jgi:hypothetical protein